MRDDFSRETLDTLAKRVGYRCSNPSCGTPTTGPRTEPDKSVSIGVGAHISAASPGGPRYDANQSPEERSSAENGIWLCQNCAKLIDNDTQRYTAQTLKQWKLQAETQARASVEGDAASADTTTIAPLAIELSYKRVSITGEHHDYSLEVSVKNTGHQPVSDYYVELEMPTRVLNDPLAGGWRVAGRSGKDVTLFRAVFSNHTERLFPGDTSVALCVPYHMNDQLFWNPKGVFDITVRGSVYASGFSPVIVERPFKELQCF